MHDKKRPVEGEHLSTGRWFLSFKPHGIASQHLPAGDLGCALRGKRDAWVDGLLRGRVRGQRFANTHAVRAAGGEAPPERAVAEFLFHRDRLGRAQLFHRREEKAARVVLKPVRNRMVFPSCSKGTPSQKAILSQPRTPFFSAEVLNST